MADVELLIISVLPGSHRHLSCLTLFAVTKGKGIETKLLFIPDRDHYDETQFAQFLRANSFKVIGLSVTTGDYHFCRTLTAHIRHHKPEAHVIWGGIHPISRPDECIPHVDSLCIGDGEVTLPALFDRLIQGTEIYSLAGIGYRGLNGDLVVNPPPPVITDLDSLPAIHYDFERFFVLDGRGLHQFSQHDYALYSKHNGEDFTLMTSRSCPYDCSYCINSFLNKLNNFSGKMRRHSVDYVLREIALARSQIPSIQFINFIDDFFLTSRKWTEEFCTKYQEHVGLPFIIRTVPATITESEISRLKAAGLAVVQTGIQSGSQRTHDRIFHRRFDREVVMRAAGVLVRHQVKGMYDFIIENDFEDDSDRDQTISVMLDLPKPYEANLFVLTVFPKTDLEMMYQKSGMKSRVDPYQSDYLDYDEDNFYYQLASIIPTTSTKICRFIFQYRNAITRIWLNILYKSRRAKLRNVRKKAQAQLPTTSGSSFAS